MDLRAGTEYLWQGITWATGKPTLLITDTKTRCLGHVDIMGLDLGFRVTSPARFCTGRYRFTGTFGVEPVPCPGQAQASHDGQCRLCQQQDEFRFAHHIHAGGHVPPALAAYMAQPHWLYIATFPHGASKVGTAAAPRKKSRLDEQGAMYATYLAQAPDGRAIRHLEDIVSRQADLPQAIRRAAKLAALAHPEPSRAHAAHERAVASATAALAAAGTPASRDEWTAPAEAHHLHCPPPHTQRAIYPHHLHEGEHRFHIESCAGTQILARLSPDPGAAQYVLDLNALKGRRITPGDFPPPETILQTALF